MGAALLIGGAAVALGLYRMEPIDVASATLLAALTVLLQTLGLTLVWRVRELPAAQARGRRTCAGTMFAASALSAAGAAGLLAQDHAWIAGSVLGLVVALVSYVALPTVAGLAAATALSIGLTVSTVAEVAQPTPLSVGAALIAVGLVLALLSTAGLVAHRRIGVGLGACVALVGAQQPLASADNVRWAYLLTLAVGCACLALYRLAPVAVLLGVGVIGTAIATLEATWDLTTGAGGVAATLAVTGAAMLASSSAGMYLWRAHSRRPEASLSGDSLVDLEEDAFTVTRYDGAPVQFRGDANRQSR
jgi:hypothetical protein